MKCHGDNNSNNQNNSHNHSHSPLKHMLHMIICCGLPILIIAGLPWISRLSPGLGNLMLVIAPFVCPIMMLGMIPMMMKGNSNKRTNNSGSYDKNNMEMNDPNEP